MSKTKKDTIGILGGMGTLAGLNFTSRLIKRWGEEKNVDKEWDYPHFILDSDPTLPSRTLGILNDDDEYLTHTIGSRVSRLIEMGAREVYVPCNTAHHYLRKSKEAEGKYVDMIYLTCYAAAGQKMHVLGGEGTTKSMLYDHHSHQGYVSYEEDPSLREVIELVKKGIKMDWKTKSLRNFQSCFIKDGVNVLGCTEFSVVVNEYPEFFSEFNIIDPVDVAITHIIEKYE